MKIQVKYALYELLSTNPTQTEFRFRLKDGLVLVGQECMLQYHYPINLLLSGLILAANVL